MTTQELKQQIDKVLGNSIRCLLPSYWWKRLFNQVADRIDEVEQSASELVESKANEVKMPIVESVDELEKLELAKGRVAAVEKVGEPVVVNLEDCYLSADAATDWDKYTVIRGFSEKGAPSNAVGQIHLYSDKSMENGLTIACGEGKYFYYKIVNGRRYDSSLEEVNKYLASGKYRLVFGYYIENISAYVTLYSQFPQPSLYIKGDSWEKLSKEYVVSSEEELNALSVENGTIAKVARELKQINRANCHTVIKFSDIPANWDKFTRVDKVEHIGGNTSNSCGINLAHYDGHNYVVLRINFEGSVTYVASVYVDSTLTNEVSITKAEVDVKLKEYDFRYIGPTFTMGEPYIDSTFILYEKDISVDAYIKGETWTRLLKEGDVVGGGAEIRELYIGDSLTDEQKAWNLETLELAKQGKAIVRTTLHGNTFILELFNEDNDYQFGYTQFSPSGGVAISVGVTEDGLSGIKIEESHFDSELSTTSINAVQNKVITAALGNKADKSDIKTINGVSLLGGGNIVVDVDTSNLATKEELNAYATSESLQSLGLRIQNDMDTDKRELTEAINTKQDKIDDLEAIRSGAALGATSLQEHQDISHLATKEEVIANEEVTAAALNDLNDRISELAENAQGETVTKEEFETAVSALTALSGQVETLSGQVETAVTSEQLSSAVDSVNNTILENEEITAAALVDLNTKITDILERLNNAGL